MEESSLEQLLRLRPETLPYRDNVFPLKQHVFKFYSSLLDHCLAELLSNLAVGVDAPCIAVIALCFVFYNFCRTHKSLRVSPAMAAGGSDRLWPLEDIVAKIDEMAPAPKAARALLRSVRPNSIRCAAEKVALRSAFGGSRMRGYWLYCLEGSNKITRSEWIESESDEDAIMIARAKKHPVSCELWQRDRKVATIPAVHSPERPKNSN